MAPAGIKTPYEISTKVPSLFTNVLAELRRLMSELLSNSNIIVTSSVYGLFKLILRDALPSISLTVMSLTVAVSVASGSADVAVVDLAS